MTEVGFFAIGKIPILSFMPIDAESFAAKLLRWYGQVRRDLPWRPAIGSDTPPDPYAVLVSEIMLQQTQVATVTPYFLRFMKRFPTVADLASAPSQEVLRLWQGLGYYSRARHLQEAAIVIVNRFAGRVPDDPEELLQLPGVGRYTAGAVASIAFGRRAAVVDGNVARVICRLQYIKESPKSPKVHNHLWNIVAQMLPVTCVGEFNSALMELGATVCTPRSPNCSLCPVRDFCQAAAAGVQESIPCATPARKIPLVRRWTICIRHKNRWLIEQRPATGRWAGMWQFVTIASEGRAPTFANVQRITGLRIGNLKYLGEVRHALTHRKYIFRAFVAEARLTEKSKNRKWVRLDELDQYPMSKPQLRIAEMLQSPKKIIG
jgi:A/G-specific adenine glycosylase